MVVIECPHCEEHIELDDDASGLFECPFCEGEFEWGEDEIKHASPVSNLFESTYSKIITGHGAISFLAIILALISLNSVWLGTSDISGGFYLLSAGEEGVTLSYSSFADYDSTGDVSFAGMLGVFCIILFWIGIILSLLNVIMDGLNLFDIFYFRTTTIVSAVAGALMTIGSILWALMFPLGPEDFSLQFGFYSMLLAGILSLVATGLSISANEYLD